MPDAATARRYALLALALALATWFMLASGDPAPAPTAAPEPEAPQPAAAMRETDAVTRRPAQPLRPTSPAQRLRSRGLRTPGPDGSPAATTNHHGVVHELRGPPAAEIVVVLQDRAGTELDRTTSDEDGRFTFDTAPPPGAIPLTLGLRGEGPRLRHRARWRTPDQAVTLFTLPPAEINGTVVDKAGRPQADMIVRSDRPAGPLLSTPFEFLDKVEGLFGRARPTGPDGRFRIPHARHGTHHLRAVDSSFTIVATTTATAGDREVVLTVGESASDSVSLRGAVTDATSGAPLAGIRLWVERVRRSKAGHSARGVARAVTDSSGNYVVNSLRPGTYRIVHRPGNHTAYTSPDLELEARRTTHDLQLWTSRSLDVRVQLPDGTPAQRAWVTAHTPSGQRLAVPRPGIAPIITDTVRTSTQGRVRFRALPATTVEIRASIHDLLPAARQTIDLSAPAQDEVLLHLPCAPVRGGRRHYLKLADEAGDPIHVPKNAEVSVEIWADGRLLSSVTGHWIDEGFVHGHGHRRSHAFDDPTVAVLIPPSPCEARIRAPGYYDATLPLTPELESPSTVTLRR